MAPLIPDGKKKLSKRDGAKDVLDYLSEGYLVETIINFIASLGWNDGTTQEIYSIDEIKDRFELGENAISQSAYYSYRYARDVIKARFELGEKTIGQSRIYSAYYVFFVFRDKLPEEQHNKMIASALTDNLVAIQYLKLFNN